MKLNHQEKRILRVLSNKRKQKSTTIEKKLGYIDWRAVRSLLNNGLIKRKQVPVKETSRSVSRITKTVYYITEEGLNHILKGK